MPRHVRDQIEVLRKAEGGLEASIIFALSSIGVFVALAADERSAADLATELGCDTARLERLLNGGVAIGALTRSEAGTYRSADAFASALGTPDADHFLGDWLEFLARLMPRLLQLGEATSVGGLRSTWPEDERDGAVMAKAMDSYARARGLEIVERLDVSRDRRLVDLGCGSGAYSIALAKRNPDLFLTLVDLPEVAPTLRALLDAQPDVRDRVEVVSSDIFAFEAGEPYDVVLLSNVLHMIGPLGAPEIIARSRRLLRPEGRIVVQAQFLDDGRVSPRWSVLLDVIQLVTSEGGANHSLAETTEWLERAGFCDITRVKTASWNVCDALVGLNPR